MTTLVEIPGIGEVEFPDSMTPDEIRTQVQKLRGGRVDVPGESASQRQPTTRSRAAARGVLEQFIGNLLAIPQTVAGMGVRGLPGTDVAAPQIAEMTPTPTEALGASQAVAELPAALAQGQLPSLSRAQAEQAQLSQQAAQDQPGFTAAGKVGGDVATLLTGRAPLKSVIQKRAGSAAPAAGEVAQLEPGAQRFANRILNSAPAKRLARAAGKSTEAGFEGAILAMLDRGNPVETGVFTASTQLAGSGFLELGKGLLSGGPLKAGAKLGMTAFAAGSIIQLLKSATPGGRDFILESMETGFDKVTWAIALGAVAGAAGAGRLRGKAAEDFPLIMDDLSAVPRGVITSIIKDWRKEEESEGPNRIEAVFSKLGEDPEFFTPEERRRLIHGFESGNLVKQIDSLSRRKSFRAKLLQSQTAGPQALEKTPQSQETTPAIPTGT